MLSRHILAGKVIAAGRTSAQQQGLAPLFSLSFNAGHSGLSAPCVQLAEPELPQDGLWGLCWQEGVAGEREAETPLHAGLPKAPFKVSVTFTCLGAENCLLPGCLSFFWFPFCLPHCPLKDCSKTAKTHYNSGTPG